MAKLHIKNRYWVTPQEVLNHRWLSWKSKGLYGYIQSKPENWDFAISRFEGKDWKDSTQSWVWELEQFWYLHREKKRQPDGTWDIEYTLYESPEDNPNQGGKPVTVSTPTMEENPPTENPATDNPPTIKDIYTKTEVIKHSTETNDDFFQKSSIDEKSESVFLEKSHTGITETSETETTRQEQKIETSKDSSWEILPKITSKEKNEKRAKILYFFKISVWVEKFKDFSEWQEAWRMEKLIIKLGKDEFIKRMKTILSDDFKKKNCNKLSFLRKEIESFIAWSDQKFDKFHIY